MYEATVQPVVCVCVLVGSVYVQTAAYESNQLKISCLTLLFNFLLGDTSKKVT